MEAQFEKTETVRTVVGFGMLTSGTTMALTLLYAHSRGFDIPNINEMSLLIIVVSALTILGIGCVILGVEPVGRNILKAPEE